MNSEASKTFVAPYVDFSTYPRKVRVPTFADGFKPFNPDVNHTIWLVHFL